MTSHLREDADRPLRLSAGSREPASFTGEAWLNPDKSIGITISDVFDCEIHLIGVKEGNRYRLRGWRGRVPDFLHIPMVDGAIPADVTAAEIARAEQTQKKIDNDAA